MKDIKQKIIEALDVHWDDLDEEQLLDILLNSYKKTRKQILKLQVENAKEREDLMLGVQNLQAERQRMRSDPLLCAAGEYFFVDGIRKYKVFVQGNLMELCYRNGGIDYLCPAMHAAEWHKRS